MSIEPVNDPWDRVEAERHAIFLNDPMIADPWLAPALCGMSVYALFGDWRRDRCRAREIASLEKMFNS